MVNSGRELIKLIEDIPDEIANKYPEIDLRQLFSSDKADSQIDYFNSRKVVLYTVIDGRLILDLEIDIGKVLRLNVTHIERFRKKDKSKEDLHPALKNISTILHCKAVEWINKS
ncbi:MAG: hypothetical protein AB1489_39675 [Acidobacteriota bacterium]